MRLACTLLTLFFCSGTLFGQTNVRLQINHMLGTSPFQFNTVASNNNNVDFEVERMQYYLSQITIIHDGGQQTLVPNTWFLIDAGTSNTFDENLGSFNVTNVEGISFGVGVEQAVNHLDPASYSAGHPLAPQNPSMHWGWQAGYRFVAMEGKAGNNFTQSWEIHALDDALYYETTITTTGFNVGSDIVIALDGDYAKALYNIDVSTGPIVHGSFGDANRIMQNFRDHVFTPALTVGVEDEIQMDWQVGPNPVIGSSNIRVNGTFPEGAMLQLVDISGRVLESVSTELDELSLNRPAGGLYFLSVISDSKVLDTRKVVVLNQ